MVRVQQDHYAEAMRRTGGWIEDTGAPFPWELQALVANNDTFESTYLSPMIRRVSTFVHSKGEKLVIPGLPHVVTPVVKGHGVSPILPTDVVALGSGFSWPSPDCNAGGGSCFVALQRLPANFAKAGTCHRIVAGSALSSLREVVGTGNSSSQVLCVDGSRVHSLVPAGALGASVVAWDPPQAKVNLGMAETSAQVQTWNQQQLTCLRGVGLDTLQVGPSVLVDGVALMLYDAASKTVVTIGFATASQLLTVRQYDPVTLAAQQTHTLPLTTAWLLNAARLTDGYVVFIGAEDPFFGFVFTVDLRFGNLYQTEPPAPGGGKRPKRRKFPRGPDQRGLGDASSAQHDFSKLCPIHVLSAESSAGP